MCHPSFLSREKGTFGSLCFVCDLLLSTLFCCLFCLNKPHGISSSATQCNHWSLSSNCNSHDWLPTVPTQHRSTPYPKGYDTPLYVMPSPPTAMMPTALPSQRMGMISPSMAQWPTPSKWMWIPHHSPTYCSGSDIPHHGDDMHNTAGMQHVTCQLCHSLLHHTQCVHDDTQQTAGCPPLTGTPPFSQPTGVAPRRHM